MDAFSLSKIITCGLFLCVSMRLAAPSHSQVQGGGNLPVLYGIKLDSARIAFDVVSSGCTDASHFSVQLDPVSSDTYQLSIIRHRQDRCRMSVHIITLTLDIPTVPNLAGV